MDQEMNYHDIHITALLYERQQQRLCMAAETGAGDKILLEFHSVEGWDLSSFEEQNILFGLYEYNQNTLPQWIKMDYGLPEEYLEWMELAERKLFYLDASVGMHGYIIASKLSNSHHSLRVV